MATWSKTKEARVYPGENTMTSISGAGETGKLHVREWNQNIPYHHVVFCFSPSVMSDSFVTPWTVACQVPLSMGFPRQECWSGLPFPSPGDLPSPKITCTTPTWQVTSLSLSHMKCLPNTIIHRNKFKMD